MRIVILVFLCFLVLVEAENGKKHGKKNNGGDNGPHVEIHGTVLVKLPKAHPKPTHIVVMVKPVAPNAKEHEEEVKCDDVPKEDKTDKAHTSYSCPYKKLSVAHRGHEKIKVGARLDAKKHLGGNLLHQINGQGKEKEEAWSLPVTVPENHQVDFNFNLKKEHVHPTIKVKGQGHISVHIKGHVHLKLVGGHEKPKYVTIMVKTKTHQEDPQKIKTKSCEKEACEYEGNFFVTKDAEGFHIAAHVGAQQSDWSLERTVPESHNIIQDMTLHLTNNKGTKPKLDLAKQQSEEKKVKGKGKKAGPKGEANEGEAETED